SFDCADRALSIRSFHSLFSIRPFHSPFSIRPFHSPFSSRPVYTVHEIFYTLQGEGANSGRAAIFCRFSGCNLWSGREGDRATAICDFCDTDFVGVGPDGGKFATASELAAAVAARWPDASRSRRLVVCTGGEPLLQ